jgi:hypothetical protein
VLYTFSSQTRVYIRTLRNARHRRVYGKKRRKKYDIEIKWKTRATARKTVPKGYYHSERRENESERSSRQCVTGTRSFRTVVSNNARFSEGHVQTGRRTGWRAKRRRHMAYLHILFSKLQASHGGYGHSARTECACAAGLRENTGRTEKSWRRVRKKKKKIKTNPK